MKKIKNIKKKFLKIFILLCIINSGVLLIFSPPTIAVGGRLNVITIPPQIVEGQSVTITWNAFYESPYLSYYSKVYQQKIGGGWQLITTIYGSGSKSYNTQLNAEGEYKFRIDYYSGGVYDHGWYPGPFYLASEESNIVRVIDPSERQLCVSASPPQIAEGQSVTITWNAFDESPYEGFYSKVLQSKNGGGWQLIATIDGTGIKSYSTQLNAEGEYKFRIDYCAEGAYYYGWYPGPFLLASEESNTVGIPTAYALLIAGCWDDDFDDEERFVNDVLKMKDILVEHHGFNDANVYLVTPHCEINGIEYHYGLDNTKANLISTINTLTGIINEYDELVVFWAGHGDINLLRLRNMDRYEEVSASEFDTYLDRILCDEMYLFLGSCYSGSLIDDLTDDSVNQNRYIYTSCAANEVSFYSYDDLIPPYHGPYSIFERSIYNTLDPNEWGTQADINGNGKVSLGELRRYSYNDIINHEGTNGQQHPEVWIGSEIGNEDEIYLNDDI